MPTAGNQPVDRAEADALFEPLAAAPAVAACVSGGADSLALLHLLAEWRARRSAGPGIIVLTVDHGLRPSSAGEAAMVRDVAERTYGLEAETLRPEWNHPGAGIEEAARKLRYRALVDAARSRGITHLVLAHHLDDQAETFLMRLARGSSVYGLAGMRRSGKLDGVVLFRPFLGIPKARLQATAAIAGLRPVDDESNSDGRFLRARLRRLLPEIAREGLDADRLAGTASTMARVAEALDHYAGKLIEEAGVERQRGFRLSLRPFGEAPHEIRLRVLTRILQKVGGGDYPPRSDRLAALEEALRSRAKFRRTLGGVLVDATMETAEFRREIGRRPKSDQSDRAGTEPRPSSASEEDAESSPGIVRDRIELTGTQEHGRPFTIP